MKKLFALLMVAGTFAMYSCGGEHKEEAAADSTAVETTTMDTASTMMADSSAMMADTAAAPAADSAAHPAH